MPHFRGAVDSLFPKFTKTNTLSRLPVRSCRMRGSTGDAPRSGCRPLDTPFEFHYAPRADNSLQEGSGSQGSKGRASPDEVPYPASLVIGQVPRQRPSLRHYRARHSPPESRARFDSFFARSLPANCHSGLDSAIRCTRVGLTGPGGYSCTAFPGSGGLSIKKPELGRASKPPATHS
jgi:hypothetical protein